VFKLFISRGVPANESIAASILSLRSRRALILGYVSSANDKCNPSFSPIADRYEHHAAWLLEDSMAGNLTTVNNLLTSVWIAAVNRVNEELNEIRGVMKFEGREAIEIEPWDYRSVKHFTSMAFLTNI